MTPDAVSERFAARKIFPLTPEEQLVTLIEDVIALDLPHGIENSLLAKLESALAKLQDGNPNNDGAAINKLEAFINEVEAQIGNHIPEEDAEMLIDAALDIIDLLLAE